MLLKISTQKSEAEIKKDTISPSYEGIGIHTFLTRAEKSYNQSKFNRQIKFGHFGKLWNPTNCWCSCTVRAGKDYEELKKDCPNCVGNQKMMNYPEDPQNLQTKNRRSQARTPSDTRIGDTCREMERLHLLKSKGP